MKKENFVVMLIAAILLSCTAARLQVPESFSSQATRLPVKGLNGWMVSQQLSFGQFQTSRIKRGWDFSGSLQWTKFRISPEESLLRVFDIHTDRGNNFQRNRFHYTVGNGGLEAEVWATEKFREQQLVYKSNNPYIGNASKTHRYEYGFTAAIVPLGGQSADPWSLVLINRYDIKRDTARRLFDRPYVEEEGYVTNGKENIAIRPLRMEKTNTASGKQTRILGGPMLAGYELQQDGAVIGMIDILDNSIWVANGLAPQQQLILASVASAILLKRMQDVEKDKAHFEG